MADAIRGKRLFDGLLDYPLPAVAGTRDYVFVVPADGYGKAARKFFKRFYGRHVVHPAASLEHLVRRLHDDVTQGAVQHIREVVIVAHGTPLGLEIPVLASTTDQNMKVLTAYSMAMLQPQISDGPLTDYKAKRAAVVSRLGDDSWVTVRACNFGQSEAGMYALYSFFGGRANVYAPMLYQLFGNSPIGEGMRYPNRLAVHGHLVRQRLKPKDVHTPDRQDAVVRALADPGAFAAPFALSTEPLGGGGLPEYEGLVNALNAAQVSPTLRAKVQQHGFKLTAGAKAAVVIRDSTWKVRDRITDPGASFPVEFDIGEQVDLGTARRTLLAQAHLPAARSTKETVPVQLFLTKGEQDLFNGELFKLAKSRDDEEATAPDKLEFDALRALLEANGAQGQTFSAGGVDLRAAFDREGRTLADDATITATTTATEPLAEKTWKVGPDQSRVTYLIKLEHPYEQARDERPRGVDWVRAHALNVFLDHDEKALKLHQDQVLSFIGTNLDSPGVELAASMDRLSIDDLVDLITYLRAPYRPRNAIYLDQAQQAISRKGGYWAWWRARFPDASQAPFPSADPLTELSLGEQEDKRAMIYDFRFAGNWAEVKASTRTPFAFQKDLFAEESLAKRFRISEELTRTALDFQRDSPYTDVEELRHLESLGFNQYFAIAEKLEFPVPRDAERVSCADFRAAAMTLRDLSDAPVDQLAAALAGQSTAGGTSHLDIILELRSKYSLLRNLTKIGELSDFLKLPSIPDPTSPYDVPKSVAEFVVKRAEWEVGIAFIKYLGTMDIAVTIPWKLWKHFLETQMEGVERWKAAGRLTAVRKWLRELIVLTRARESDFPDDVSFDLTLASRPDRTYYHDAFFKERDEVEGTSGLDVHRFVLFADELKEGFDEGAAAMNRTWPEIRRIADEATTDVLRSGGLDSCRAQALVDAGFLDSRKLRAIVVRSLAERLLKELPYP